jgi:hypothetical protein
MWQFDVYSRQCRNRSKNIEYIKIDIEIQLSIYLLIIE